MSSFTLTKSLGYSRVYTLDPALHGGIESFFTKSGLDIDSDGAPRSYAPPGSGLKALDVLADGGYPGEWYGGPTDKNGKWIIQGKNDPDPGYIVSSTSWMSGPANSQRSYVDASTVPYLVKPGDFPDIPLGSLGIAYYGKQWAPFVVADVGPRSHFGEGSVRLADMLGIPSSPINGGVSNGVYTVIFPKSLLTFGDWNTLNSPLTEFLTWGGQSKFAEAAQTIFGVQI